MTTDLDALRDRLVSAVEEAADLAALEDLRISALGKKGEITAHMKQLGGMDPEQRKQMGQALNQVKAHVAKALDARKAVLENADLEKRLAEERVDVTLPVAPEPVGSVHPISQTIDELTAIFSDMGFTVAEGPDIEDDFHNFDALNIPPEHPARQEHDTFYLPPVTEDQAHMVLRTHTSPVQIRTMMGQKPPIRVICPGRTYRADYDATHSPNFHQVEGLVIDKATHMGHLKGCLIEFCKAYFEVEDVPVRFRASHFPFTEPSAEMDIGYAKRDGQIKIGAGNDWLEIVGCGMVHPKVLRNCGLDPDVYQGFAFGMGIERIAMLKYGIPDLRTFYEADVRWLRHYGFAGLDIPNLYEGLSR